MKEPYINFHNPLFNSRFAKEYGPEVHVSETEPVSEKPEEFEAEETVDVEQRAKILKEEAKKEADPLRRERINLARTAKSQDILKKLATDEEIAVVSEVAANENTPADVLSEIYEKYKNNYDIKYSLAGNSRAGNTDILGKLAEDSNPNIRGRVARNSGATYNTIKKLMEDEDTQIRVWAKATDASHVGD